jgi:predicted DNA-binding transcriptional regulator AlpA
MSDANSPTLALPFIPRGLSRVEAARYIGVSPGTFDKLVGEGTMPKPKQIRARRVWDREAIDLAFANLDGGADDSDEPNDFDHVLK